VQSAEYILASHWIEHCTDEKAGPVEMNDRKKEAHDRHN